MKQKRHKPEEIIRLLREPRAIRVEELTANPIIDGRTAQILSLCVGHKLEAGQQRGCNENTNGLIRQYLPKGIDLAEFSQTHLNRIAMSLNTRPRRCLDFQTPMEVYERIISDNQNPSTVALGS